jgi:hypothetical protein
MIADIKALPSKGLHIFHNKCIMACYELRQFNFAM